MLENADLQTDSLQNLVYDSSRQGNTTSPTKIKSEKVPHKFGTVDGVFLPTLQNVLGVIFFIRLPWVVGQGGTLQSTFILLLSAASTFLTALSLSALATNGKIPSGGPNAIVTDVFGPETGGAIGVLFYLGTTIDATLYILGAVEVLFVSFDLAPKELHSVEYFDSLENEELKVFCLGNMTTSSQFSSDTCFGTSRLFTFDKEIIAVTTMLALGICVIVGLDFVHKISIVFLAIVFLAIFLILVGLIVLAMKSEAESDLRGKLSDNFHPHFSKDFETGITPNFTYLLSIFYPAVTGIMAGANRSGVLKDPSRSIPTGTLGAIVATSTLYFVLIWMFGSIVSNEELRNDKLIATTVAWPNYIPVGVGIIMSCIEAALQTLVGGPELLAKMASDGHISFLSIFNENSTSSGCCAGNKSVSTDKLTEENTNNNSAALETSYNDMQQHRAAPRKAIFFTTALAAACCLAGNLDYVSPIVTMFFLAMHGFINLACFSLAYLNSPGFRPSWKYFHWSTALAGFLLSLALMFLISTLYAFVAIVIAVALFLFIKRNREKKEWGSAVIGYRLEQATQSLLALNDNKTVKDTAEQNQHLRGANWRPQLMVLCHLVETTGPNNEEEFHVTRPGLLRFASQLKKGRGLVSAVSVMKGEIISKTEAQKLEKAKLSLRRELFDHKVKGFATVVSVNSKDFNSVVVTFSTIFQTQGLGALQANTVLLSWPRQWKDLSKEENSNIEHLTSCQEGESCNCVHKIEYTTILKTALGCQKALVVMKSFKRASFDAAEKKVTKQSVADKILKLPFNSSRRDRPKIELQKLTSFDDHINETTTDKKQKQVLKKNLIDVFWLIHDGGILILLPYLLMKHKKWVKSRLRIFLIVPENLVDKNKTAAKLSEYLTTLRVKAEVHVVPIAASDAKDIDENRTVFIKNNNETLPTGHLSILSPELFIEKSNEPEKVSELEKEKEAANKLLGKTNIPQFSQEDNNSSVKVWSKKFQSRKQRGLTEIFENGIENYDESSQHLQKTVKKAASDSSVSPKTRRTKIEMNLEKRLKSAERINSVIVAHSKNSQLVVLNLPLSRKTGTDEFIRYTEILTKDLDKVILIRGNGFENVHDFNT